jgi:hypothetical protein
MTERGMIENGTTPAKPGGGDAIRQVSALPLPVLTAGMLAVATAFFCYAMPQRVLGSILGHVGVAAPVGGLGRTMFMAVCAAVMAFIGWLAVTRAGGVRVASPGKDAAAVDMAAGLGSPGVYPPGTIEGAPPPLAVRRSDGPSDAPPRRPIFADDDLLSSAAPVSDPPVPVASSVVPAVEVTGPDMRVASTTNEDEPTSAMPAAEPAPEPATMQPGVSDAMPQVIADGPSLAAGVADPLELVEPEPARAPQEPTIAALMDRFERGLDCQGSALPPPPSVEQIAALHDAAPGDDALRTAIEALSRLASRPR